jgi:sterol 3beta-glucosyltransferase
MPTQDAARTTRTVLAALERAGQRGVLASGWGGLAATDLPPSVYLLDEAPHDWLFPQMAAVVHHGGAGTTAAGLRAGVPTVICPFFGDQPFWGRRVVRLGVGPQPIPQRRPTTDALSAAIRTVVSDPMMRERAAVLGSAIRAEDGVGNAVTHIEAYIAALNTPFAEPAKHRMKTNPPFDGAAGA